MKKYLYSNVRCYSPEITNDNKSGANALQSLGYCKVGKGAVVNTGAVRNHDNKLGGAGSEWILRCFHQAQETITVWEFFVANNNYNKSVN